MHLFTRLLSICALGAASLACTAAPAQKASLLPPMAKDAPCASGVISKTCTMNTLISNRVAPLIEMWEGRRFKELDRIADALCTSDTRLPDGQPELLIFDTAFRTIFDTEYVGSLGTNINAWRKASPNSTAQALAEIRYWELYAWRARGNGYANTVPPEAWDLFRKRMANATARLKESKAFAGNCPLWHSMYIDNLLETGAPRPKIDAAYAEAVKAFPSSQQIHYAMSRTAQTQWGGAPDAFERFARNAVKLSQRDEGSSLYTRLYWNEDCNCQDVQIFSLPGAPDWNTIKAGFEDMLQRYPDEVHNRNKFAYYACRANDRATYAKLRRELGNNIIDYLWPGAWKTEVCDLRMAKKPDAASVRPKNGS